jgi:predicted RNase H-like HicB family nuclease
MSRTKVAAGLTFRVTYEPDGSGWHARIPSVPGCLTWGRSLSEARRNIREALSTCADAFADADRVAREAELVDTVRLPVGTRQKIATYTKARSRLQAEQGRVRDAARGAAIALTRKAGVSLRDAGELLGLSRERVRRLAG